MSWNRYSSLAILFVTLLLLAAGVAGAVTVSNNNAPDIAEVGTTQTATITVTELFQNPSLEEWTLVGETQLENTTWTVTQINQAGGQVGQNSYDGKTFSEGVNLDSNVAEVRVKITGTVPPISNYSYNPAHAFLFAELRQTRQGGTSNVIVTHPVHHYTPNSRAAEDAIRSAQSAISAAGGHQQAEQSLDSAISAYDNGNFQNAVNLANRAEDEAKSAQAASERNQMLLYAGVGIVVLLVIVGGLYYWRSQQTGSKL